MDTLQDRLQRALGDAFTVERELGGGGMSRVFVTAEPALGRKVVVKLLSPELAATVSVERFRREILLSAALQHPHIVPVLSAGELDGLPYFTMPYVEGESLRARLARGSMPVASIVSVLKDVARALAYAHERGVVHRDIKPDNVLLAGGSAVVADFGVAKALLRARGDEKPTTSGSTLTFAGTSLGTPAYMAPEQAAGDPETDHRADIYAFGVMAYEMLAGRTPFYGRSPQALLAAQLTEAPPPLAALRAGVPIALEAIVTGCLAKDPAARPQTAADLAAALEDPAVVRGAFASAPTPTATPVATMPSRRRMILAGAATAVVAAAAIIIAMRGAVGRVKLADRQAASASTAAVVAPVAAPRSVAVLPFVVLDGTAADAQAADAIADRIASALTRVPGARVASRTASAPVLATTTGSAAIAHALNVRTLVEGTVQREGSRVRVAVRLVNAADGFMLWADVYDGKSGDRFAMEDQIATGIATALAEQVPAT